jgi:hypothetical protein
MGKADKPKIGEGHASAMLRQGVRELRGAMYTGSNVAQPGEYGLYATQTPGEVAEARRPDDRNLEEETPNKSIIGDRLRQSKDRDDRDEGPQAPDLDRD